MREIRTYHQVVGGVDEDIVAQVGALQDRLTSRLSTVRRIVVVGSGKGGVGKSAVAANLAALLASSDARVGAVDADLSGPSLARMLGARTGACTVDEDGVHPAAAAHGVRVMSMDLLVEDEMPLRWRDPPGASAPEFLRQSLLETGALREFLADTVWGPLDYLIIDAPPGTDKILRLLQLLPRIDLLLLITTPADIARFVVAKAVRLAADAGVARMGLVANMTTHVCTACGYNSPLFDADGARRLADAANLPLWAEVPFDARIAALTDAGRPFALELPDTAAAGELRRLAGRVAAMPAEMSSEQKAGPS